MYVSIYLSVILCQHLERAILILLQSCLHSAICARHPCAGAILIFSESVWLSWMITGPQHHSITGSFAKSLASPALAIEALEAAPEPISFAATSYDTSLVWYGMA